MVGCFEEKPLKLIHFKNHLPDQKVMTKLPNLSIAFLHFPATIVLLYQPGVNTLRNSSWLVAMYVVDQLYFSEKTCQVFIFYKDSSCVSAQYFSYVKVIWKTSKFIVLNALLHFWLLHTLTLFTYVWLILIF